MKRNPIPLIYRVRRRLGKILAFFDLGQHVASLSWFLERRKLKREAEAAWKNREKEPCAEITRSAAVFAWCRRHWLLLTFLTVISIGTAAFRPAYRRFREWQTDNLLESGSRELERGEWTAAESSAQSVLLARKNDLRAVWQLFRARRGMGALRAVETAWWLGAQPKLTADEHYEILEFLVTSAPQGAFLTTFARLPTAGQEIPRFRALYARFLTNRKDFKTAGSLLDATPGHDSDERLVLERARLACGMGTPEKQWEALQCFQNLNARNKSGALTVLRMIAAVPRWILPAGLDDPDKLDEWLRDIPGATIADRLMAFDGKLASGEPAEDVSSAVIKAFGDSHPVDAIRWLNRHGRHEDVLQMASRPGINQQAVFGAFVEAQIGLGFPDIARVTLAAPPPEFDATDVAFLRVRVAEASKDPDHTAWDEALKAVSGAGKCSRAFELAELATRYQRTSERENALTAAFQHPGVGLPLYRDIAPLAASLARQDRIPELIGILANLARFEGGNAHLRKSLLYLRALSGKIRPEEALPVLRQLGSREPDDAYTLALSFVLLLAGEAGEAVRLLEPVERRTGNNKLLEATLGTALKLCGRTEEAGKFLAGIDWGTEKMMPIESRCLQRLLSAAPADPPREPASAATP